MVSAHVLLVDDEVPFVETMTRRTEQEEPGYYRRFQWRGGT